MTNEILSIAAGTALRLTLTLSSSPSPWPVRLSPECATEPFHEAEARGQNFGQVSNAFVRIVNEETNEELIRYDLAEDFSIETAIIAGELYRHNGEWKFSAIGSGYQGGLARIATDYGLQIG